MRTEVCTDAIRSRLFPFILGLLVAFSASLSARADSVPLPFDLIGPELQIKVTRAGKTLPISAVPNLQPADKVWIRADLPSRQSARYLLVVAFLQGPTNPPPENWFTEIETWGKKIRDEGSSVEVPQNAQQALVFLAPETSGGFGALRSMVRGKPGIFVRASQDLEEASLERTRLDKFLDEIKSPPGSDTGPVAQRVALLSRTLGVKADPSCFEKPADQQQSCLTQDTGRLILSDMKSESLVTALTSGASADLVGSISTTPLAARSYFSPYVGSAMDLIRLFNGLRTPELQYLPALAQLRADRLNLRLNSPPSFQNPRSVLVVGLPAVTPAIQPDLRAADAKHVFCLQSASLVLPVAGEPLVFSTGIAHDFVFRLQDKSGNPIDLPAAPDAARGGFTVDISGLQPDEVSPQASGKLHGLWGFDSYDGPSFDLRAAPSAQWTVPPTEASSLLAGRPGKVNLHSASTACVEKVSATDAAGNALNATWRAADPDVLEVDLALKDESAGTVKLLVQEFGSAQPDEVTLHTYSEPARLDRFMLNSGDQKGILTGLHLDQVSGFELNGVQFAPAKLAQDGEMDSLGLIAPSASATAGLPAGEKVVAHVTLKDGRVLELQTTVEPPRPEVTLVSKSVQNDSGPSALRMGNQDELPQNGRLSFLLKSEAPDKFPRDEEIEVATTDGSSDALLSLANGGLVLQDAAKVLAVLNPLKTLGPTAFGPLQFRPVDPDGKGDWQPLARVVRIPTLREVRCPDAPDQPCSLSGADLFLLDSVASGPEFKDAVSVQAGYSDTMLNVPRPNGTLLYIKLRDDPAVVDTAALPVLPKGN
jgi:hypothetical protein